MINIQWTNFERKSIVTFVSEELPLKKIGEFERPLKVKKNGVFIFVISYLVPEIFKVIVLCKLGTDDVIRCDVLQRFAKFKKILRRGFRATLNF